MKRFNPVAIYIRDYIRKDEREALACIGELNPEAADKAIELYVDRRLSDRKERLAKHQAKVIASRVTPKKKRPFCIATNETNGKQCQARQKWDKKANKAVNGYCFTHQHLADKSSK